MTWAGARRGPWLTRRGVFGVLGTLMAAALLGLVSLSRAIGSEEGEGLYVYKWPRPRLAIDPVVIAQPSTQQPRAQLLLVRRKNPPFKGYWSLPGGFVNGGERLEHAVTREVLEETAVNLSSVPLTQVGAFDGPGRDGTTGWCIGVTYVALVPPAQSVPAEGGDDAAEARWHDILDLPKLGFDHKLNTREAFRKLADEPRAQAVPGLLEQLRQAADLLGGAWQHATIDGS